MPKAATNRKKRVSATSRPPAKRARKTRQQLEDDRDHRLIEQAEREGGWIRLKDLKRELGL